MGRASSCVAAALHPGFLRAGDASVRASASAQVQLWGMTLVFLLLRHTNRMEIQTRCPVFVLGEGLPGPSTACRQHVPCLPFSRESPPRTLLFKNSSSD